jgi:hypothetical protein
MFCVYLTSYRGNKLPSFYIGSSSVDRVNNGYHGSVVSKKYKDIWQQELKNSPELFNTIIICTHSTRKEAHEKENKLQKALNVVKSTMYINMSFAQPNGYAGRDTSKENNPYYGKKHSPEVIVKMKKAKEGNRHPWRGKKRPEHSKKLKGVVKPMGFGEKVSNGNKGKHHGSPKGTLNHNALANIDRYLNEYIKVWQLYNQQPALNLQYNIIGRNGKLITYDIAFSKEYTDTLNISSKRILNIIRNKDNLMYQLAMSEINAFT